MGRRTRDDMHGKGIEGGRRHGHGRRHGGHRSSGERRGSGAHQARSASAESTPVIVNGTHVASVTGIRQVRIPDGVSPLILADGPHALGRVVDRATTVVASPVTVFPNERGEAASTEPASDRARELFDRMVAEAREPVNYDRQTDIGDVFIDSTDELGNLLQTGLHERLMDRLKRLRQESTSYDLSLEMYHKIFSEIGHGIALAYLIEDDVLLTSDKVASLNKIVAEQEDSVALPEGAIVDKDGKIVLVYATVLMPDQASVNEAVAGMREFIKRFDYLCGGEEDTPRLLLISRIPNPDLQLDSDTEQEQVMISLGEIKDYARENIFDQVSPVGRRVQV